MVAGNPGEDGPVDGFPELVGLVAAEDHASLGPEVGLVGGRRDHVRPLAQGVLELAAGDEAQNVRGVVEDQGADLGAGLSDPGDRLGEEEERAPQDDQPRPLLADEEARGVGIEGEPVRREWELPDGVGVLAERPEAGVADVAAAGDAVGKRGAALLQQGAEDGLVGGGPAGQTDVGPVRRKDLLHERLGSLLHLIDIAGALVIARAGVAFRIAMVEVGVEKRAGGRREYVLARDQVDRLAPPPILRPAQARDLLQRRKRVHLHPALDGRRALVREPV